MDAKVVIVGATTWGTALAINLARKQIDVCLLTRTPEEAHLLTADGQHNRFLPGVKFPESLTVSGVPDKVVPQAGLIIIVVPSDRLRQNVL
ncbi:MAG: glycerol-3-phosphate dehydrogenase, partial [Chloroflexi bacterium]|nr:glycerol-3-phosphate dehydrogenase [Chloroflexota bacterium]